MALEPLILCDLGQVTERLSHDFLISEMGRAKSKRLHEIWVQGIAQRS